MNTAKLASRSGIFLAIFSSVLFGASTPLAKLLLGTVDAWLLAALLYLGSGIGLANVEAPLRSSDLPWMLAAVLTGGLLAPVLLMFGLSQTPASSAALLLNVEGLATMAIAWLVFRENVDSRILVGALAILAGAVLLSWRQGKLGVSWPAIAIGGACVSWAIDNNLTRKLSAADPVQIAMIKGLGW